MKTGTKKKAVKDRYLELVQYVPLRPIKNEDELDEAINMVNYLLDQLDRRSWSPDEKDYIDVLGDLIEKYESEHIIFKRSPAHKMLRFLIETKGVTQAQVAKDFRPSRWHAQADSWPYHQALPLFSRRTGRLFRRGLIKTPPAFSRYRANRSSTTASPGCRTAQAALPAR
jgi:antitoxin component HigA of HigAB toxin-antitoxin module